MEPLAEQRCPGVYGYMLGAAARVGGEVALLPHRDITMRYKETRRQKQQSHQGRAINNGDGHPGPDDDLLGTGTAEEEGTTSDSVPAEKEGASAAS